ncbi:MAG TPA: carboxypeptidase-like regulatory domain-containing protein, partial [Paludibacteraceae bacterium]|nr:carboxypeptidase-like regulatory domain-containing protein [Paludibacteraceae bacterium]
MRKTFLLTAFVLFFAMTATGQHFIKGKVLDENQHPLEGANVFIKSEGIGKITDKNGEFFFENLSRKSYQLDVSYVGFETLKVTTQVDREIIITLKSKDYLMDEIIITSLRANERSAVAYSEVKKEEIE